MPNQLGDPKRTARIACCRLDPQSCERSFPENAPVANTVQRNATGQAQSLQMRFFVERLDQLQSNVLGSGLDTSGDVRVVQRLFETG